MKIFLEFPTLSDLVVPSQKSPLTAGNASTTTGPHVESTRVVLGEDTPGYSGHGEIISTQTVSSKTRTVETITVSSRGGMGVILG